MDCTSRDLLLDPGDISEDLCELGPTVYGRLDDSFFQVVIGRQDITHVGETQSRIARVVWGYWRRGCV